MSFGPDGPEKFKFKGTKADWVKRPARRVPKSAFMSVSVSSDSHFLAIGGGDSQIHVFDLRSEKYLRAFSGKGVNLFMYMFTRQPISFIYSIL